MLPANVLTRRPLVVALAAIALAVPAGAQGSIPVRAVAPPSAATTEPFRALLGVRELPDGRVLIDDAGTLRLMLFDATLKTFTIVSDTSASAKNNFGDSPAPITAFTGDSTLFLPFVLRAFLVIDPKGEVVRVAALPKAADLQPIFGSRTVVDPAGRLWYRGRLPVVRGAPPVVINGVTVMQAADSAPIVRADFDTRAVDTIAYVRMPKQQRTERTIGADGVPAATKVFLTPVSTVDDWTVTTDGTLAIVRGQDYHIDWIAPDGRVTSTPKMAFDWRRMTDEEKQRLADSAVAYVRGVLDGAKARQASQPAPPPPRPGAITMSMIMMPNQAEGSSVSMPTDATVAALPLSDMPDFFPPLRGGTVKSDLENNVWILPNTSAQSQKGGIVYDVVNRQGELFERVELPGGRSIAGFGRSGTLYMMWRDSTSRWHVEKTRVVR